MRRLLIATGLVSAAAIGLEILLMRLLSIVQWHHFAYMIISLALLGYGASGSLIAVARRWLEPRFSLAFTASALFFSISIIASFLLAQRVPFNALEIVWDLGQLLDLSLIYLLFFVPFFFAACCIGLGLSFRTAWIGRIYAFDLVGAGLGASLILGALFVLSPPQALLLLAALALVASILMATTAAPRRTLAAAQLAWASGLLFLAWGHGPQLVLSPYKGLSQALEVVDSRVLASASSPLGLLTVVESSRVPLRYAPGLSMASQSVPPEQLAVFTDGDAMTAIDRYDGSTESVAYLGDTTAALPFALRPEPRTLVLGAGGGRDVLMALHAGAESVDAVELNPQLLSLVSDTFSDYSGHLFRDPRVTVHVGEARGFIARSQDRFDVIHLGLFDSFAAAGSGVQALNENYLYTVQALRGFVRHTEPDGLVSITRWLQHPPRHTLKLVATAIEALRHEGVAQPGNRLALIRGWNTATLLIRNGDFPADEIAKIVQFSRSRSFDTAWYPGMTRAAANRYNLLPQPDLFDGVTALLGEQAGDFKRRYKFGIEPATDDRPYFFLTLKWRSVPEFLTLVRRGGAALVEWGYLVLSATLVQAALFGLLLIVLPLARVRPRWPRGTGPRMGGYFFLLGLAFLFVEIAFIQKFILFLSHPLYAVAVVLSGFLVFAGIGSALTARITTRGRGAGHAAVAMCVAGIAMVAITYLALLPALFEPLMGLPDGLRILLSFVLIAPLGVLMGMPFPIGLARLSADAPEFIPWAWALNGFASVISSALATLLAIQLGFSILVVIAVGLYAAAATLLWSDRATATGPTKGQ